jgi:hypothetical protein
MASDDAARATWSLLMISRFIRVGEKGCEIRREKLNSSRLSSLGSSTRQCSLPWGSARLEVRDRGKMSDWARLVERDAFAGDACDAAMPAMLQ